MWVINQVTVSVKPLLVRQMADWKCIVFNVWSWQLRLLIQHGQTINNITNKEKVMISVLLWSYSNILLINIEDTQSALVISPLRPGLLICTHSMSLPHTNSSQLIAGGLVRELQTVPMVTPPTESSWQDENVPLTPLVGQTAKPLEEQLVSSWRDKA